MRGRHRVRKQTIGGQICHGPPGVPSGVRPKSERARDSEAVRIRQFMCIPSISERISRILLAHARDMRAFQGTLRNVEACPPIRVDPNILGPAHLRPARLRLA